MSSQRRRTRSRRIVAACSVLAVAFLVVAVALVVETLAALTAAAVVALLTGIVAARVLVGELAQTRREWAKDRAEQARSYQGVMAARMREQAVYAASITDEVTGQARTITELHGERRLLECRLAELVARLRTETYRSAELQADLSDLRAEAEEIAAEGGTGWDGADVPTIVDLLNWEQAVAAPAVDSTGQRKPA